MKCTAHKKSGAPCGKEAIAGGNVCRFHGGAASQVKAAAKLRLLALVNPALAVLARSLKEKPMPERAKFPNGEQGTKAFEAAMARRLRDQIPHAVALKAATEVLDRCALDLENKAEMGPREMIVRFVKAAEVSE